MFPVYKISAVVGGIIKIFYSFNKASNEASNDSVNELPYPSIDLASTVCLEVPSPSDGFQVPTSKFQQLDHFSCTDLNLTSKFLLPELEIQKISQPEWLADFLKAQPVSQLGHSCIWKLLR